MGKIIKCRPDLQVDTVTKHKEVGDKKQERKPEPAAMQLMIRHAGGKHYHGAFDMKQKLRFEHKDQYTATWRSMPCSPAATKQGNDANPPSRPSQSRDERRDEFSESTKATGA